MRSFVLDVADAGAIRRFADQMNVDFPKLNVLINNAGIMQSEDVRQGELDVAEATVATNLLGPIRLTAALLPLLERQPHGAIMTVTSGLAFVPRADNPTYGATKAALHSYTESLRHQLKDTSIQVIELVPPYTRTSLQGERQANDPNAMPLGEYIAETMQLLRTSPDAPEILVERVKRQRFAEARGDYEAVFGGTNLA